MARTKKQPKKKAAPKKRGRPTSYSPKLIAAVDTYIDTCADEESEFWKTRGEKSDSYERIVRVKLPTLQGYSQYIGVHIDTLYEWAKKYQDFSEALGRIRTQQHEKLVNNALSGNYNPVISKLLLMSNHGYVERKDVTTDGQPIQPDAPTQALIDKALSNLLPHGNQGHSR